MGACGKMFCLRRFGERLVLLGTEEFWSNQHLGQRRRGKEKASLKVQCHVLSLCADILELRDTHNRQPEVKPP